MDRHQKGIKDASNLHHMKKFYSRSGKMKRPEENSDRKEEIH
jgi:hypothetical protein